MNPRLPLPSTPLLILPCLAFLVLVAPVTAQDRVQDNSGKARVVDDKTAKQLLKDEKEALGSKEPRVRKEALERLAKYSNEALIATFTSALKDRDPRVVVASIQAMANQPGGKAQSNLLRLLKNKKIIGDEALSAEVIRALGVTGWDKRAYATLRDFYDDAAPKAKKELLRAFTAQKEIQSFSLFVDNLDEPRPKDVNAPNNPPASYWKAKYKEWTFIKSEVRRGLEAVSGRKFENAAEARSWAKTREARKLKIRYKSGG